MALRCHVVAAMQWTTESDVKRQLEEFGRVLFVHVFSTPHNGKAAGYVVPARVLGRSPRHASGAAFALDVPCHPLPCRCHQIRIC